MGVFIVASPLGAGFLGNNWKSKEDIPEGDHRRHFDKFSDEHFEHNMVLVRQLEEIAQKRGVTAAQLSIAWVAAQWEGVIPLPGSVSLLSQRPNSTQPSDSIFYIYRPTRHASSSASTPASSASPTTSLSRSVT
jgi:hypothetical protein